jgi:lysophospholipase L1-like esterase
VTDPDVQSLVIVGDSITDGRGSTDNANNRWPDLVLARLHKSSDTSSISVVNQAAGGNRILYDGLGPNALSRLDRDVFAHPNVAWTMIFEGINDITGVADSTTDQAAEQARLIWAYKQFADRAHTKGLKAFIATITPWKSSAAGSSWTATREVTRSAINSWIRNQTVFDAYADFDAILRDSSDPQKLQSAYDSGDGLHPNVAGYQAIADNFPVDTFF